MNFITENIAVGSKDDLNMERLKKNKVTGILNVAIHLDPSFEVRGERYQIEYHKIGLNDNEKNQICTLWSAVYMMEELLTRHKKILVNCRAGASRSVTIVALYLTIVEDMEFDDALKLVKEKRIRRGPMPGILKLAKELVASLKSN